MNPLLELKLRDVFDLHDRSVLRLLQTELQERASISNKEDKAYLQAQYESVTKLIVLLNEVFADDLTEEWQRDHLHEYNTIQREDNENEQ